VIIAQLEDEVFEMIGELEPQGAKLPTRKRSIVSRDISLYVTKQQVTIIA